ncbi:ABC transporter substrate-binding protein [Halomicrobium sp. HM KBTZ05]|uniref:ABC transporter substrate-binding protein n=1 Tax=Halomicrobium sp. HM KBTZ05 TaxID=3242663 RepID=UPI0035564D68
MKDTEHTGRIARLSRRQYVRGVAGSALAVALAGCQGDGGDGGDGGAQQPEETTTESEDTATDTDDTAATTDGSITFAQAKSPVEFDPIVLNDVPSSEVAMLVFDSLYTYDEGTNLVPQIAADMPEVERGAQRWIVPIRTDATFQNGDPVTAEDVAYSFQAPVEEETENAGEFNMIDTVDVVDESTVQFDLQFQFGAFDSYLPWEIVDKSVRESDKDAYNTSSPVGAGPFTFDDWQEGEYVRLSRWDDYWGEPLPNLAEIEFVPVEEPTTRITTLRTGENDVVKNIPPANWETVENMGEANIESVLGTSYFYLAFNCNEGPTADPEVREAIDYAFSMDDAVGQYVEPTGERQYAPVPRAISEDWEFPVEEWQQIPHEPDVDQAKSLLDDNDNVPDDWQPRIIVPPDDKREQIGVSVSNGLSEAGYDATVQRLDWGAFLEQYVTGSTDDYNMYTLGWAGSPDPDTFMYFLFAHDQIGTNNGTYYRNESMNEQIMNARQSNDDEQRREWYVDAIQTVLEDRVHLPSYNIKNSFGVRSHVSDFRAHPVDQFSIVSAYNNVSVQ